MSRCALNVKARGFGGCILPDIAVFSDPFPLTLQSSWERRRRSTEGMGPEDDEHFVGSVCACFQLAVHLANNWNVLVVYSCHPSATIAKSSNMYFIFYFYVLCFFFFSLFLLNYLWWLGLAYGMTTAISKVNGSSSMTGTTFKHKMNCHRWCRSSALCEVKDVTVVLVMPLTEL